MKNIKYYILLATLIFATSCEEYLDKSPDFGVTDQEVYSSYESFKGALDKVYALNHDFFTNGWNGFTFALGDEGVTTASGDPAKSMNNGNYNQFSSNETSWGTTNNQGVTSIDVRRWGIAGMAFKNIRTVNICLERINEVQDATPKQVNELMGQAYFFRAWNYFQLIRRFGGFFKFDHAFESGENVDLERMSYQESTDWLVEDLDKAFELLPHAWPATDKGRATKMAALALKSMALLYAASPNMNPDKQYNTTYCELAAKAAADAINYLENTPECHNRLMPGSTVEEYNRIFYNRNVLASDEAIFYTISSQYSQGRYQNIDAKYGMPYERGWRQSFIPRTRGKTNLHMVAPTQDFVDLFETDKGLPIADDVDYNDQDPYSNRDPRFYYDILTNGTPWNQETPGNRKKMEFWEYDEFENRKAHDGNGVRADYPGSPYAIRKWWPETVNKWEGDYDWYMQSIHIRVAQLYLDFAEAANEVYGPNGAVPGSSYTALSAINKIRARVNHVPVPSQYTTDKETFRSRIWNERTVELCYENHRWHDIRRWRIAHIVMQELHKAIITRIGEDQYTYAYGPILPFQQKTFEERHYWYPIPQEELDKLSNFTQNPGW